MQSNLDWFNSILLTWVENLILPVLTGYYHIGCIEYHNNNIVIHMNREETDIRNTP